MKIQLFVGMANFLMLFACGIMPKNGGVAMVSDSGLMFVVSVLVTSMLMFLYVLFKDMNNGKEGEWRIMLAGGWVGWALSVALVFYLKRRGIVDLRWLELVATFVLWHYSSKSVNPPSDPPSPPSDPPRNP